VVGYQCLTGRLPFEGEPLAVAIAHLEQRLPPLPSSVPPGAAALVAALTAKDPRARPASAGDVAAWADQLGAAVAPGSGPAGRPARASGHVPAW
jgi:serine/threonine-protein kinase